VERARGGGAGHRRDRARDDGYLPDHALPPGDRGPDGGDGRGALG
jgi:hypothetical protein